MTEAGESPTPHLSLVIPAYNEERRIADSMHRIATFLAAQPYASEVIVVDDGSDLAGRAAARDAVSALPPNLSGRVVRHEANRGKGAAVRTGCAGSGGRLRRASSTPTSRRRLRSSPPSSRRLMPAQK